MSYPTGQLGGDLDGNPVTQGNNPNFVRALQLGALQAIKANGSGSGSTSIASNVVALAASSSQVIPIGSKGWTVSCLTGTVTIAAAAPGSGSAAALPAGFSDSDPNVTTAAITVTTASASTAYIRWGT